MRRRSRARALTTALLAATAVTAGCRPASVEVTFRPAEGATYSYRYEIDAVVRRSVDGSPTEERSTTTVLLVTQRLTGETDGGTIRAEVSISRDGGPVQRGQVRLDRAGSLAGIDLLGDAPATGLELLGLDGALLADAAAPPTELGPGERWQVDEPASPAGDGTGRVTGSGRVERLHAAGGRPTVVTATDLRADVDTEVVAAGTPARVRTEQRSAGTTAYDLADGAIRWSRVRTTGAATVRLDPPTGSDAEPVVASVSYEIEVRSRQR